MTTTSIDELFAAWSPLWDPPLVVADAPHLAPHVEFVSLEIYEEENLQPQDDIAMQDTFGGGVDNTSVDKIPDTQSNWSGDGRLEHSQGTPQLPQVSPDRMAVPIVSLDDGEGGRSIGATAGSGERGGPALLVPVPNEQQEGLEEGEVTEYGAQATTLEPAVEITPRRAPSARPLPGSIRALQHALDAASPGSRGSPGMSPRNRLAAGADGGGPGARQVERTPRTQQLGRARARDSPETPAADTRRRKQGRQTSEFATSNVPTRQVVARWEVLYAKLGACPQTASATYALVRKALVCCFPSRADLMVTLRTGPVRLAAADHRTPRTHWEDVLCAARRKVG
uniref:Uncharacterized protein n=1 Tax=Mycena chlorophos TaxID=658473 RepID=A0ABQ0LFB1_MYCCL|nr:predicted protein [Mycena chlorophos]